MRTLLIVVTVVALTSALVPTYGRPIAELLLGIVAYVAPVCLITAAVYCRGMRQTFFLGAALAALTWFWSGRQIPRTGSMLLAILALVASCILWGALAVATRRLIEWRGWDRPDNSPPRR
jgi:hypothetical protein